MKWQPMDTAPKDGTRILLTGRIIVKYTTNLYVERTEGVAIGYYSSTSKWNTEGNALNRSYPPQQYHFTGWMPLPEIATQEKSN